MLVLTKSFQRDVIIDSIKYQVIQNHEKSTLVIKNKKADKYLYVFANKVPPTIIYKQENKELIQRVFSKAHVERYML